MENKNRDSISLNEKSRLGLLEEFKIIRTSSSKVFDELAAFTANLFSTQIAVISFVDQEGLWTKHEQSSKSVTSQSTGSSICSLAIANDIADAFSPLISSPLLVTNALFTAEFGMGFFAAVPIVTDEGIQVGTVCVVDKTKREFNAEDREKLEWVAGMVKKEIKLSI